MASELQIYAPQKLWRTQVSQRLGIGDLSTTATTGFLYIPTCLGIPTGVPEVVAGMTPMVFDGANGDLYAYMGGNWVIV